MDDKQLAVVCTSICSEKSIKKMVVGQIMEESTLAVWRNGQKIQTCLTATQFWSVPLTQQISASTSHGSCPQLVVTGADSAQLRTV